MLRAQCSGRDYHTQSKTQAPLILRFLWVVKLNGLPRLHLLLQDNELGFIHWGWKAGKGLVLSREVGKGRSMTRPLVTASLL